MRGGVPLALEDTRESGQRAKLDDYPDSALLVFYGVEPRSPARTATARTTGSATSMTTSPARPS